MNKLVWLRNDLRITDNQSFSLAFGNCNNGKVYAAYSICDKQWDQHEVAPARRLLVIRTLIHLQEKLKDRGVTLIILDSGNYKKSAKQLSQLAKDLECDEVYCGYDYPLNEKRRDKLAHKLLEKSGIRISGNHNSCLIPTGTITKKDGTLYQVFTPFKNMFFKHISSTYENTLFPVLAKDKWKQEVDTKVDNTYADDSLKLLNKYTNKYKAFSDICDLYLHDEAKIIKQLESFCNEDINNYHTQRDIPLQPGTSQISMYLSLGSLSVRTAFAKAKALSKKEEGCEVWISELLWREFYRNIMSSNRRLSMGHTFRKNYEGFPWSFDETHYEAWQKGMTGVPIVDAAMRQLNETGWMHNRLRMVTAMFLTKYLRIDWKLGESYFMAQLVDGDFAANNGGWQWSASTGTDSVPYFRVLSPVRQAERFDSKALFIKKFVPELAPYSAKDICKMNSKVWEDSSYPQPIIDLSTSKKETVALFKEHLSR